MSERSPGREVFVNLFSCPSEHSARVLANAIMVAGLRPQLRPPRLPDEPWRVSAPAELVASPAHLSELRETMTDAAERAGARYEGCEPAG